MKCLINITVFIYTKFIYTIFFICNDDLILFLTNEYKFSLLTKTDFDSKLDFWSL